MASFYPSFVIVAIFLSSCLMKVTGDVYNQLDEEECKEIGLNKEVLPCSSCDLLDRFLLSELREGCLRCCNPKLEPDNETGLTHKYAKARLEVCWCKFPSMPQIEAFVKSDRPKKFPNLEVKHVNYQNPIIKLMNKDGNVVQTLSITKWNTDTIDEFLATHLDQTL